MNAAGSHQSIVLTPPGAGAIGVVRVMGGDAPAIVDALFRARDGTLLSQTRGDRLHYGWVVDGQERIDDGIVSHAVASGVPAVDICVHGGVRVIERLLVALEQRGAALLEAEVEPASVWPAANLIEKEAVGALARAKTERAVRFLGWQRTHLAAALEEAACVARSAPKRAQVVLEAMIAPYPAARTLIEGAKIALVGPANSGKSALFNLLVGRSGALVSPRAGTTRDWVVGSVEMDGVPVTLVDTAGHDAGGEGPARRAISAGWDQARQADLCLIVLDGSVPLADEARALWRKGQSLRSPVTVINKRDAGEAWYDSALGVGSGAGVARALRMSAKAGAGVDRLVRGILAPLGFADWRDGVPCLFTERQVSAAREAVSDVRRGSAGSMEAIKRRLVGV